MSLFVNKVSDLIYKNTFLQNTFRRLRKRKRKRVSLRYLLIFLSSNILEKESKVKIILEIFVTYILSLPESPTLLKEKAKQG